MKTIIKFLVCSIIFISCNTNKNNNDKADFNKPTSSILESKKEITKNIEKTGLNFDMFRNSKWIIGEVGINGEKPDTIIFISPNKLVYVSTDTGKQNCYCIFKNDTLPRSRRFVIGVLL